MTLERLSDHELTVCVETAAEGVVNSRAGHTGGPTWDKLAADQKNSIREQALPFIFHGTKALADLGFWKNPTITTADELQKLYDCDRNVVVMDDEGLILQNLAGGWKSPGNDGYLSSARAYRLFGPTFRVLLYGEDQSITTAEKEAV
ncbi:hypothetical protein OCL88_08185 [Paenarthrobacter sp. PAE-2]|uniref:hypothetical protein n=1 Tax=Paenarthrobacter sp. PAE-2 TaxID=2982532 RepID=UPI00222E2328|nr:hypothetical protein [Paenarthrobacter sp. PAE-2]MCW3766450.1 hypothetical protein [Paenarthrobacter sp. PAE-2]